MFTVISKSTKELWGIGNTPEEAMEDAQKTTFHDLHPATKNPTLVKVEEIRKTSPALLEILYFGEDAFMEHGYRVKDGVIEKWY